MNNKYRILLIIGVLVLTSCGSKNEVWIPKANPLHPIKDLPYYRRDTLNFYQVSLDSSIVHSLDTIVCPEVKLPPNIVWCIDAWNERRGRLEYSLSYTHIENDLANINYKVALVGLDTIFVLDYANHFTPLVDSPLFRVANPHQFQGIASTHEYPTWHFELKKGKVRLTASTSAWNRRCR